MLLTFLLMAKLNGIRVRGVWEELILYKQTSNKIAFKIIKKPPVSILLF